MISEHHASSLQQTLMRFYEELLKQKTNEEQSHQEQSKNHTQAQSLSSNQPSNQPSNQQKAQVKVKYAEDFPTNFNQVLPHKHNNLDPVSQESRRRVFYTIPGR